MISVPSPQTLSLLTLINILVSSSKIAGQPSSSTDFGTGDQRQMGCRATAKDIEGPYYKRNSPVQQVSPTFVPQICKNTVANDRLFLNGTIRQRIAGRPCGKSTRAILDIWHANAAGSYSDKSPMSTDFSCRTRLITNDDGTYTFSSIFPGRYDDGGFRPAHVHFQITPVDRSNRATGKTLTTQLYFAQDHFLKPRDSCGICGSDEPTLISHVSHSLDIKTFAGTWDVLLA